MTNEIQNPNVSNPKRVWKLDIKSLDIDLTFEF